MKHNAKKTCKTVSGKEQNLNQQMAGF